MIPAAAKARFAADLGALHDNSDKIGIALSGGPDSLALLLLAHAVRPGQIEAATVEHGLRKESRTEAEAVAAVCRSLDAPHAILPARWPTPPGSSIQAQAREERYALLAEWAAARSLGAVATAHHADDQAETLLMRLARGAGIAGLSGARPSRVLSGGIRLIRPLLGWRKAELGVVVASSGLRPSDDASNRDERFDRVKMRGWLANAEWLDAARIAASAANLREADDALDWSLGRLLDERLTHSDDAIQIDPSGLPREYQRRMLLAAFDRLGAATPRGGEIIAALDRLRMGETLTLSELKLHGGERWRLTPAPPRRRR